MGEADAWESFYVMTGGAAAALTGLIFVAVSLHTHAVMADVLHRDRAWASIAILTSQLIIAALVLVPAQPLRLLGIELILFSVYWVIRTLRVVRDLGSAMRRADRPPGTWIVEWVVWVVWVAVLVVATAAMVAENGEVAFAFLALAMVGMFAFAIWNAWVLMSEVSE